MTNEATGFGPIAAEYAALGLPVFQLEIQGKKAAVMKWQETATTDPAVALKMWEGETNTSMKKGLGHYSSTSAWDGNVGICGHNRGTKYAIGAIKDLEKGDTITYTTIYGTRTYAVTQVRIISNTDWSYLQGTPDNRLTLTTCLADHPESRVMVQAVEVRS